MARPKEDKSRIQCKMRSQKKQELDDLLIGAGFCYRHKDSLYPLYGEFLEGLVDNNPKACDIFFRKVVDKP
jgi:hypothetical protein